MNPADNEIVRRYFADAIPAATVTTAADGVYYFDGGGFACSIYLDPEFVDRRDGDSVTRDLALLDAAGRVIGSPTSASIVNAQGTWELL